MTPTEPATYYRENAAECLLIAKRVLSASERLALVDIAQAWTALHHAEKNRQFFAVGEDLELHDLAAGAEIGQPDHAVRRPVTA